MSVWTQINKLTLIKNRYFHTCMDLKKNITHHIDCSIYAVNEHGQRGAFCDCGLIHDLRMLDFVLAGIIYDRYEEDLYLHETGKNQKELTEEELKDQENNLSILEEIFGPITTNIEEIKEQYNDMEKVLVAVFPNKSEYPSCYKNLEKWFAKKEI